MKIYTKAGDAGETGLYGGARVSKDDARVEAYGTVDELNCALGVARAALSPDMEHATDTGLLLARLQRELFDLGAELATPPARLDSKLGQRVPLVTDGRIGELETHIDRMDATLEPLKAFILPGGTPLSAALHVARAVCRRAERRAVTLARMDTGTVRPEALRYLNRLSDLLFVLARYANHDAGVPDVPWHAA
jgi:cob(I)alamin adenosyltransferase